MNKSIILKISLYAACGLLLAACGTKEETQREKEMKMLASEEEMPVDVAKVEMQPVLLYKEYPGTLESVNKVNVVGRVNGYLKTTEFSSGDMVEKGQVLFTIEDTQYRNAVEEAEAALEKAKSNNEYYSKQYEAMQKALERDAVSQMEVMQAKSNFEQSIQSIKTYEAQLETAKANLSYCTVRSPFRGRISAPTLSNGAYVGGGAAPVTLATIYDTSEFYADFFIEDASLLHIQNSKASGLPSNIGALPVSFSEPLNHSYTARITYFDPQINTSTGMIKIQAKLPNPYGELRDGMYVNIKLPYQHESSAILVKDASIATDQLGKYVYLVNDSNKVVYTPIEVGDVVNDSMRVVNSGLKQGDIYVTKALLKVRNGKRVKPVLTR